MFPSETRPARQNETAIQHATQDGSHASQYARRATQHCCELFAACSAAIIFSVTIRRVSSSAAGPPLAMPDYALRFGSEHQDVEDASTLVCKGVNFPPPAGAV
jgi:hypothetical protein